MAETVTSTETNKPTTTNATHTGWEPEWPDVSHLMTEDDTPVDNWYSEKQQRLLTEPLHTSWAGPADGRPFVAAANVGLFPTPDNNRVLVPDMFLSLDASPPKDWWQHRAYFLWEVGKAPEVVIEIVSNRKGHEVSKKLVEYARMGVFYYVVLDRLQQIQDKMLQAYVLTARREYEEIQPSFLAGTGLGLTLWQGVYEGQEDTWLRWQDTEGNLILTGQENVAKERARADRLAAKLREMGVELDK